MTTLSCFLTFLTRYLIITIFYQCSRVQYTGHSYQQCNIPVLTVLTLVDASPNILFNQSLACLELRLSRWPTINYGKCSSSQSSSLSAFSLTIHVWFVWDGFVWDFTSGALLDTTIFFDLLMNDYTGEILNKLDVKNCLVDNFCEITKLDKNTCRRIYHLLLVIFCNFGPGLCAEVDFYFVSETVAASACECCCSHYGKQVN